MRQLVLNNQNYVEVLSILKELCKKPFKINGYLAVDATAKKHHLFDSKIKPLGNDRLKLQSLILISYNGSLAMVLKERDRVSIDNGIIAIEQDYDLIGKRNAKTEYIVMQTYIPSKQELDIAKKMSKMNKDYSDSYWKGVEQDMTEVFDRGFDEEFY